LVVYDPEKCITTDTIYQQIRVSDIKAELAFREVKLDPCDRYIYRFDNLSTASGRTFSTTTQFIWDFGDGTPKQTTGVDPVTLLPLPVTHTYPGPGSYKVTLQIKDTTYCNNTATVDKTIRVASLVKANFETPPSGCAPYNAVFKNTSEAGATFHWDFGDGNTSGLQNPTHTYAVPGTYIVTLTATDPGTCNIEDKKQFTIIVFGKPTAAFTHSIPQINVPISFTNNSSNDAVRFKWEFGDGDSLVTTSRNIIQHEYNKTGSYTACLTAYNSNGCPDRTCLTFSVEVQTALDVPNAFTPLSGDVNSKVFVKGYGIAKMKFIIWARWGEKVFETDDRKVGWDGTYKGKLLPMDVYAYTLEVEFFDGTRTRRKGDITLIR